MENIIEVRDLKKSFSGKTVVSGISFGVERRGLFAFLGQNGAGKTTTINMIIGLIKRDEGEIFYNGSPDFLPFKNKIGVVYQNNILDNLLSVEENLLTYGALYINRRQRLKERFNEVTELLSLGGFLLCGIYMPYGQLGEATQAIGSFLPFSHITVWLKQVVLNGAFKQLGITGEIKDLLYGKYFFSADSIGFATMDAPLWLMVLASGIFALVCLVISWFLLGRRIKR